MRFLCPFFLLLCFLGQGGGPLLSQTYTLSGFIRSEQGGEPLIGATVYDTAAQQGAVTNEHGYYAFTAPLLGRTRIALLASHAGYEAQAAEVEAQPRLTQDFRLKNLVLPEITVTGTRHRQAGVLSVPVEALARIPALAGETDVLKALTFLPGIARGAEGSSNIYVRGGGQDQNLFLLDGAPVYNPNHLGGYLSVFQPEALKQVTVYKGGIPARYGGRLSSVVDIHLKEGNLERWQGSGSIGLVTSGALLEGPLLKNKVSLMLGGRLFYFGSLLRLAQGPGTQAGADNQVFYYNFGDANAKLQVVLSPRSRLFLSYYTGNDRSFADEVVVEENREEKTETVYTWQNRILALRYFTTLGDGVFLKVIGTRTWYNNIASDIKENIFNRPSGNQFSKEELVFRSSIGDFAMQGEIDWNISQVGNLTGGIRTDWHNSKPGETAFSSEEFDTLFAGEQIRSNVTAIYGQYRHKLGDGLEVLTGLRGHMYTYGSTQYFRLDPRLSLTWKTSQAEYSLSYDRVHQFTHLLNTARWAAPNDIWIFSDALFQPQSVHQVAFGYFPPANRLFTEWSVELYYKSYGEQIFSRNGQDPTLLFTTPDWRNQLVDGGRGSAYGAEVFTQKKMQDLDLSLSYTLSWSWRQFENLNQGKRFPYRYDRRHNLNFLALWKVSDTWSISSAWVFSSGEAFTFPKGAIVDYPLIGGFVQIFNEIHNGRLPAFHRMDLSFIREKVRPLSVRRLSIGLYNVYNRKNPNHVHVMTGVDNISYLDSSGQLVKLPGTAIRIVQTSLFPTVPFISYAVQFK